MKLQMYLGNIIEWPCFGRQFRLSV